MFRGSQPRQKNRRQSEAYRVVEGCERGYAKFGSLNLPRQFGKITEQVVRRPGGSGGA